MSDLDLDSIKARCEAATEGPWHREHGDYGCVSIGNFGWVVDGPNCPQYDEDTPQGHADAEFIAHARTDVPALVAEVERLRAEVERHMRMIRDHWLICLGEASDA